MAKILLGNIDPWLLAGLLYLGAGIGLWLVRIAWARLNLPISEARLRRSDLPWLAAVVVTGGIIGPVCLMMGLARLDAASAALLLNLEGLATMAIAWVVFRENVDRRLMIGALAILAGAALLSWDGTGVSLSIGALLVAAACLAWAIDNNLTRKLSTSDPTQIAMIKGLAAGVVNLSLAFALGAAGPTVVTASVAGLVGFFGYGISLALFVAALRHLGTARTGAYFSLAPFIGAALAVLIIGEPLTFTLGAAGVLMAIGLYLHLTERHEHEHEHPELVHEHRHTHDLHHQHEHAAGDPPGEPHTHRHKHARLVHRHPHYPDIHHRHEHV
ncbi:MAG: cobalt-nickel-resistance system protein [Alphaproteobacteria bacterium]|nr:MAG: cobalt-nickel-resistance system protein [Alphaproteobacteria bacterium]